MKITVWALTYRRPAGLKRLLDGLGALERHPDWDLLQFVIVDNDPDASGRVLCSEYEKSGGLPGPLHYIHQPIRGIARSRNAAIDFAAEGDWTAFLDDDESPHPNWLKELYEAALRHDADVVGGPVTPVLEGTPPPWIEQGGFFERRSYADGQVLGHVFTNNVLFRSHLPRSLSVRFDERPAFAALCVGEDRLFFQTLASRGAKTVYCSSAFVREWIPEDRAAESWLVGRMERIGRATAVIERHVQPGPWTVLRVLARAGIWLCWGFLQFVAGGFASPLRRTRSRRHMAYGLGLLRGVVSKNR